MSLKPQLNNTRYRSTFFKFYPSISATLDMGLEGPPIPPGTSGTRMVNAEIHLFGAGNLNVTRIDGTVVSLVGLPAGTIFVGSVKSINAGTTCTNILVYW